MLTERTVEFPSDPLKYRLERPDLLMYLQDSRHTSKLVISDLQVGPSIGSSGKLRVDFADPPAGECTRQGSRVFMTVTLTLPAHSTLSRPDCRNLH